MRPPELGTGCMCLGMWSVIISCGELTRFVVRVTDGRCRRVTDVGVLFGLRGEPRKVLAGCNASPLEYLGDGSYLGHPHSWFACLENNYVQFLDFTVFEHVIEVL